MAKIKMEDGNVVIKVSMLVGKYNQKVNYKIDLTNSNYYVEKEKLWELLEWDLISDEIPSLIDEMEKLVKLNIINNRNVAGNYRQSGMIPQAEKAEKSLENNLKIEEFLKSYKL